MSDILLVIVILIIVSGILRRLLFFGLRKYFQKMAKDFGKPNQQSNPTPDNQKTFWSNNKPKSRGNDNAGEYVDYEEIK